MNCDALGVAATGVDGHDPIARCPHPNAVTHRRDDPGEFEAWNLRAGIAGYPARIGIVTAALQQIGTVHPGCGDIDENLIGSDHRIGHLDEFEDLGAAVLGQHDRLHRADPTRPRHRSYDEAMAEVSLNFAWTAEQTELRERARKVATEAVNRYGRSNDSWIQGYSPEFSRELAAHGWIGMTWPESFGGGGRPPIERLIVAEEMIAAGAPVAASWFGDRQMGPTLMTYGTAEQQARYLPEILEGAVTWCIGMSEPNSGSDLASLTTSAVRDGDRWIINGQKIWTSFGAQADYCYLICRTSNDGPPHAGISEIIVPMDTPGIEVRPIRDMVDHRHFCEVFFTDVAVPVDNLVGVEGNAFKQTMRQLEHERGGIDRLVSNRALYQMALEHADLTDPRVRQEVARLETGYRLGRILVAREVLGQAPPGFSAATKCFCTEHEQRVADFVARTMGPSATLWDPLSAGVAYSPGYTIMGGTSNVMRNILGERVLGLPREPSR